MTHLFNSFFLARKYSSPSGAQQQIEFLHEGKQR